MRHLVMFSGGAGSYAAAKRVVAEHGPANTLLIFADTKMEDEDLYRFVGEAVAKLGAELITLCDGRDPWQVFFDRRFLGNSRVDPCSETLKRNLIRRWVQDNYTADNAIIYLGIDWTEIHRLKRAEPRWVPFTLRAPLCEKPYLDKRQVLDILREDGIEVPRLYKMGFAHNNCGGFCVKSGQAQFKLLLEKMPDRYAYHEQKEQDIREYLDANVSILTDRRKVNGEESKLPMTLKDFRLRVINDREQVDELDWGGCGCLA